MSNRYRHPIKNQILYFYCRIIFLVFKNFRRNSISFVIQTILSIRPFRREECAFTSLKRLSNASSVQQPWHAPKPSKLNLGHDS